MKPKLGTRLASLHCLPSQENVSAFGTRPGRYSYHIEGYSYGGSKIISSSIGGYTYANWDCVGQTHAVNFAPGASLSEYCDPNDGYVVLRVSLDHYIYYFTVTYVGTGFSHGNPPKILGVYHFGNGVNACGKSGVANQYVCAVPQ